MMRASQQQPGYVAALLHRLSGLALAVFLPLHFLALATALRGREVAVAVTRLELIGYLASTATGLYERTTLRVP